MTKGNWLGNKSLKEHYVPLKNRHKYLIGQLVQLEA
jgi:hypothetical protein|nr:MAG TPA: hypothetical protein [Caudoviricetes sp.]